MSTCPALYSSGKQCFRWDQPAAHTDGMHETRDGLKWPYPEQLLLDLAAVAAPALKEASP